MGEVYLVEHASSGELRAAKVMRALDGASAADLVGFRREALALLNVGAHPFIVQLFDVQERAKDVVLLMEYVAPVSGCTTVQDWIARNQVYGDRLLGAWTVQFCVGMEHALKCGTAAHRDIKPANLLIDSGAFLKIADFGLALAVSRHPALTETVPRKPSQLQWLKSADGRLTCGTPGYIAPELFVGGSASQQSDMFSFGVTLWQLAARSLASPYDVEYRGDPDKFQYEALEKALAHRMRRIESPFFDVVRRCLSPDPTRRYADFPTLREAIKGAMKAANIPVVDFIVASGFRGSFEDYINRARSYLVLDRHERALSILDRAVEREPGSYAAQLARAEALSHRGRREAAVRIYEVARDLKPDAAAPLTGMASVWLDLDHPETARAMLDLVLIREPENLDALLLLARVHGAEGHAKAALAAVERVIAIDPLDWRAVDYHGRALWGLRKLAEAEEAFRACLRINPLALDTRLSLAAMLTERDAPDAAREEYQRAVRLCGDNPETLNKIAAHMAERGQEKGAIELFQQIADAEPASKSTMMVNIGNAQLRMGDDRSAATSFRKAIEIDPENGLAFCRLGDLEADEGRSNKAVEHYARACELEPDNPRYHAFAGTSCLQQKDYHLASEYLRRSVELFPEQPLVLYNLAVALTLDGKEEAGIDELAKALQLDERYARAWYLKACVEKTLGRDADAAVSAARAVANGSELSARELHEARFLLDELRGREPHRLPGSAALA